MFSYLEISFSLASELWNGFQLHLAAVRTAGRWAVADPGELPGAPAGGGSSSKGSTWRSSGKWQRAEGWTRGNEGAAPWPFAEELWVVSRSSMSLESGKIGVSTEGREWRTSLQPSKLPTPVSSPEDNVSVWGGRGLGAGLGWGGGLSLLPVEE